MQNYDRLLMEIKGIELTPDEVSIYLEENNLDQLDDYIPTSNTNKRNILRTALSILEPVANQPELMRNHKDDKVYIMMQNNELTDRIKTNELYKIGLNSYNVIGIDDISAQGIFNMKMEFSTSQQTIPSEGGW